MLMRAGVETLAVGVLAGQLVPDGARSYLLPIALAALAGALAVRRPPAWIVAAAAASMWLGAARMAAVSAPPADAAHVARQALPLRTTLTGWVVTAPVRTGRRTIFLLEAATLDGARPVRGRVRVAVRGTIPKARVGDLVRLPTTLRRARGFANPGAFDVAGHFGRRGVFVTAAVWDAATIERLPRRRHGWRVSLEHWRRRLGRAIDDAAPAPAAGVLRALVIGDQSGVDPALRDAFTRAGVVHVLSVSGLHVGLVAAAAFAALRGLLGRSERLLLVVDVRRVAAAASVVPVAVYTALAGFEIATVRSAVMVGCAVGAVLLGRRVDVLRTLAAAALVLALAWPGAPREISFQLSFVSVLAIVLASRRATRGWEGWRARVASVAVVSPAALLGTAPLTALHFQQLSAMSVVANPLAIPLFGSVVVVLGLAGAAIEPMAPGTAAGIFALAGTLLRPGIALVQTLGSVPGAAAWVPTPSALELLLAYALLTGLLLVPRRVGWILAVVAVLGGLADAAWWVRTRWAPGVLRVTFLDVGQGDAAVAELPNGRVVAIDAGGFPGSDLDTGAAIVAPFLATRKIRRLDALAMTHAHPDHSGGMPFLLAEGWAREFWWTGHPGRGAEWQRLLRVLGDVPRVRVLDTRATLPAFAAGVAVLHPSPGWDVGGLNESSMVLRLSHGDVAVLLTGDVERRAEAVLRGDAARLAAAVLKVPHHGSRTSSTPAFLAAVRPAVAVVSVGADNRYGLPAPDVEARYRAAGVCVLRTDRCGAVTVETDGHTLAVRTVRSGCDCPAIRRRP